MSQPSNHPFFSPLSKIEEKDWLSFFDLPKLEAFPPFLETSWHTLSYAYCKTQEVLPFKDEKNECFVATTTPLDLQKIQKLHLLLKKSIQVYYCEKPTLLSAIEKAFSPSQNKTEHLVASLSTKENPSCSSYSLDLLDEDQSLAPTIRLLNSILQEAHQQNASDIHLESAKEGLCVRYRIDGVLQNRHLIDLKYQNALFTRLKILSHLDISEQRRPQDGRFHLKIGQKGLDFRLSIIPTCFGERMVLRLLDPTRIKLDLQNFGLDLSLKNELLSMIRRKEGLFLVTGPTGSGKTTTLYSLLQEIQQSALNIMTIEDPVEYQIKGISQMNVHPAIGLSFSKGLKHLLRQDPDVILIGEIRDFETAQIAIQAALTGHLVLSTLHTHDAPSSITRLIEMGIEPYLISSSLLGVLAQRLIRTLCPHCKTAYTPSSEEKKRLLLFNELLSFKGLGCETCFHTGYRGRKGIYELLKMGPSMKNATLKAKTGISLSDMAQKEGLKTLYHQGIEEVKKGTTSIEELLRVALSSKEMSL